MNLFTVAEIELLELIEFSEITGVEVEWSRLASLDRAGTRRTGKFGAASPDSAKVTADPTQK